MKAKPVLFARGVEVVDVSRLDRWNARFLWNVYWIYPQIIKCWRIKPPALSVRKCSREGDVLGNKDLASSPWVGSSRLLVTAKLCY